MWAFAKGGIGARISRGKITYIEYHKTDVRRHGWSEISEPVPAHVILAMREPIKEAMQETIRRMR